MCLPISAKGRVKTKYRQLGQGMTEYIIIVALIAIAAIASFSYFGDVTRNQVASMASELGGSSGAAATAVATQQGERAVELTTSTDVNLSTFNEAGVDGHQGVGGN